MGQVTVANTLPMVMKSIADQVESVKDSSNEMMPLRGNVKFKNGHSISIVRGPYSYGGPEGLFEIMPSEASVLGEDWGDTVMGYLTPEEVLTYCKKLIELPTKSKTK